MVKWRSSTKLSTLHINNNHLPLKMKQTTTKKSPPLNQPTKFEDHMNEVQEFKPKEKWILKLSPIPEEDEDMDIELSRTLFLIPQQEEDKEIESFRTPQLDQTNKFKDYITEFYDMKPREKWTISLSSIAEEDEDKETESFRTLFPIPEQDKDEDNEFTLQSLEETIAYLEKDRISYFSTPESMKNVTLRDDFEEKIISEQDEDKENVLFGSLQLEQKAKFENYINEVYDLKQNKNWAITLSSILEEDEDEDYEFNFQSLEETIAYLENHRVPYTPTPESMKNVTLRDTFKEKNISEEDEDKEFESFTTLSPIPEQDEGEENEFSLQSLEETVAYLEKDKIPYFSTPKSMKNITFRDSFKEKMISEGGTSTDAGDSGYDSKFVKSLEEISMQKISPLRSLKKFEKVESPKQMYRVTPLRDCTNITHPKKFSGGRFL